MKKLKFYLKPTLLSGIFLLLLACGGGDDDPDPIPDPLPDPRTADDVREDFKKLTINEGTNDLRLESLVEGVFWNFRIIVPEGASDSNKRPLVIRLHGAAQSGSASAHQSTECLVEPAFEGKDVFILSPNSNGALWYDESNIVQVLALSELTTANLNIDSNKIVVTGYSDGGNGSWFLSQFYSETISISAGIPMATQWNPQITKIEIPLYVIHGSEDDLFPVDVTEGLVNQFIDAGSDITFVVADGLVHNEPCTYEEELKKGVEWLYTEVW